MRKSKKNLVIYILAILFVGCSKQNTPKVNRGVLDLRNHDFQKEPIISLTGYWQFTPNKINSKASGFQKVPSDLDPETTGGKYQVKILLNTKDKTPLGIKLLDISSCYNFYLDTILISKVGEYEKNIADYKHELHHLPANSDTLSITIKTKNNQNFESGILSAPEFGSYIKINQKSNMLKTIGLIIIGALVFGFFFHIAFWFFGFAKQYQLYLGFSTLCLAVHLYCLNERLMYDFIKDWDFVIRLEIVCILLSIFFALETIRSFFEAKPNKIFTLIKASSILIVLVIVIFLPIQFASALILWVPVFVLLAFSSNLTISFKAFKEKKEGSGAVLLLNILMFILLLSDNIFFKMHVGGLVAGHLGYFAYTIYLTIAVSKRAALTFKKAGTLSKELQEANDALEKQNHDLEEIIERRTKQLIEIEQHSHALEMNYKQKDLESAQINNQLKQEVSRKMIIELEKIQKSDKDIKIALKRFIAEIKQQFGLGEKLNVLEKKMDETQSEFHDRLTSKFPNLSKSEIELCTLIKLNLSNKEISTLINTNANALNVARSRLRKKLEIPKEINIEVFIRKI